MTNQEQSECVCEEFQHEERQLYEGTPRVFGIAILSFVTYLVFSARAVVFIHHCSACIFRRPVGLLLLQTDNEFADFLSDKIHDKTP